MLTIWITSCEADCVDCHVMPLACNHAASTRAQLKVDFSRAFPQAVLDEQLTLLRSSGTCPSIRYLCSLRRKYIQKNKSWPRSIQQANLYCSIRNWALIEALLSPRFSGHNCVFIRTACAVMRRRPASLKAASGLVSMDLTDLTGNIKIPEKRPNAQSCLMQSSV